MVSVEKKKKKIFYCVDDSLKIKEKRNYSAQIIQHTLNFVYLRSVAGYKI